MNKYHFVYLKCFHFLARQVFSFFMSFEKITILIVHQVIELVQNIFNNLTNQAIKPASLPLASSLFVIVVCSDITFYIQILITYTNVTITNLLQLHFMLVK